MESTVGVKETLESVAGERLRLTVTCPADHSKGVVILFTTPGEFTADRRVAGRMLAADVRWKFGIAPPVQSTVVMVADVFDTALIPHIPVGGAPLADEIIRKLLADGTAWFEYKLIGFGTGRSRFVLPNGSRSKLGAVFRRCGQQL